jgi:hypothetical protein
MPRSAGEASPKRYPCRLDDRRWNELQRAHLRVERRLDQCVPNERMSRGNRARRFGRNEKIRAGTGFGARHLIVLGIGTREGLVASVCVERVSLLSIMPASCCQISMTAGERHCRWHRAPCGRCSAIDAAISDRASQHLRHVRPQADRHGTSLRDQTRSWRRIDVRDGYSTHASRSPTAIGCNNAKLHSHERSPLPFLVVIDPLLSVRGPLCADLNKCRQCW